jgi:hypothetical protein
MFQTKSKFCPKCRITKNSSDFPKRSGSKDGLRNRCLLCTRKYQAQHKLFNKNFYDKYWREYSRNRRKVDVNYRLALYLRKTVNRAITRKSGSAVRDLGCSINQLIKHLESQFKPGMTWENHGEWHIDHILPLSKFNLSKREEFLIACHYTNLQPLWAKDNIRKSNRLDISSLLSTAGGAIIFVPDKR